MTLESILEICEAYRSLGDAISEQLRAVIADPSEETLCEQNANALRIADERFLQTVTRVAGWDHDEDLATEAQEISDAITNPERSEDARTHS